MVFAIAGCHAENKDEATEVKSISECMAAQHNKDDYFLVLKCEPLGQKEIFKGTWFVGFEESGFRRDYEEIPATGEAKAEAYLVAPPDVNASVHEPDAIRNSAYQVTFTGRESLTPWAPGVSLIVIDKLTSIRRVPRN